MGLKFRDSKFSILCKMILHFLVFNVNALELRGYEAIVRQVKGG